MEITYATESAQLIAKSGLETTYATLGANVVLFLAFVGGAVVAFVFLVGLYQVVLMPAGRQIKSVFKRK